MDKKKQEREGEGRIGWRCGKRANYKFEDGGQGRPLVERARG